MALNYFKTSTRYLIWQKGYTAINLLGLSLGMACFALILLFIQDELSYDRFHQNAGRIFRLTETIAPAEHSSSQPFSVAPTLAQDYPGLVEHAVRFFNLQAPTLTLESSPERRFNERKFFFVDSTVFEVFTFPFVKGDPKTALDEPFSVVLTLPMAEKYFGKEDPMGKVLRFEGKHDLKVTGVLATVPHQSHIKFDFLASFSTVRYVLTGQKPEGWNWNPCWTYLLLTGDSASKPLAAELPVFVKKHFPDNIRERTALHLQALTDIHLRSHLDYEIEPNSDIAYVRIFSIIAAMVLLVACINYMNLATSSAAKRAREVGMRKVMGASRAQLITQFLGEAFGLSLLAVLLALPLVLIALPVLNTFFGKAIELDLLGNRFLLFSLMGAFLFTGFFAGMYPAFVLSAFRPILILKNNFLPSGHKTAIVIRKGLVVSQFVISIGLIIGTLVAWNQLHYLRHAKLGFDKEHVVMVNIFRSNLNAHYNEFKNRVLEHSQVLKVTTIEEILGSKSQTNPLIPEGSTEYQQFQRLMVGHDFMETFNLELAAGRSFNEAHSTDDSMAVLINEAMVRRLGWGSPQEALGKNFTGRRLKQYVVGVVKDFHFNSLRHPIGPIVFDIPDTERQHTLFDRYLAVRIVPDDYPQTLTYLEETWAEFMPGRPFEYFFMDDELKKLYQNEEGLSRIAGTFSAFSLLVACIGLLGLVSFMASARTKEIGIRKVLGASVAGITGLLAKDFLKLVVVAILIASPLAYFFMNKWLQDFAYRIDIQWWIFLVAGAAAVAIAFLTVGFQSVKAALANPVKSLRSE